MLKKIAVVQNFIVLSLESNINMKKNVLICNFLKNIHFNVIIFTEDCETLKRKVVSLIYVPMVKQSHISRINFSESSELTLLSAAAAKSFQSCPTLCDPIDGSPPGSCVPGILQARTLEWVVISFSNAWKWKVKVKSLSRVRPLATPWTAAHQGPLSMGFSRQKYWSRLPLSSPTPS